MSPRNEPYKVPRNTVRMFRRDAKKIVNGPYYCPKCGKNNLQIIINPKKKEVLAICVGCEISQNLTFAPVFEPVDYYNKFVDQSKKKQ